MKNTLVGEKPPSHTSAPATVKEVKEVHVTHTTSVVSNGEAKGAPAKQPSAAPAPAGKPEGERF